VYNEERKLKFIKEKFTSEAAAMVLYSTFNTFAPYEEKWGADLCTRSAADLQPILDSSGRMSRGKKAYVSTVKKYVLWCIDQGIEDVNNDALSVKFMADKDLVRQKTRDTMFASPLHLQTVMDTIFESEDEETADLAYRACLWLIYSGVDPNDVEIVLSSDIDLRDMTIHYDGRYLPIYREAMRSIRLCVENESFRFIHPIHGEVRPRARIDGKELLRSYKGVVSTYTVRIQSHKRKERAKSNGDFVLREITPKAVYESGLFYRAYEKECAGIIPDFKDELLRRYVRRNKNVCLSEYGLSCAVQRKKEDYLMWKDAFHG